MSSPLSWSIIKRFHSKKVFGFTFQDVVNEFQDKDPTYLAKILRDMVDRGMLTKLARNIYHIIPFDADPQTYLPDGFQVAKYFMQNNDYYIGFASALRIHGISCTVEGKEDEDRVYVATTKQIKPAVKNFGEITIQFIKHDVIRFFGFESVWINQYEEGIVSDLERTIVDVVTNPSYCKGIIGVGTALFNANDSINQDTLFFYFSRTRNKSAMKRYLFLTDLLGLEWTDEHGYMMEELGSGVSMLDPEAADQGRTVKKFGLKINVDPVLIKNSVLRGNAGTLTNSNS